MECLLSQLYPLQAPAAPAAFAGRNSGPQGHGTPRNEKSLPEHGNSFVGGLRYRPFILWGPCTKMGGWGILEIGTCRRLSSRNV